MAETLSNRTALITGAAGGIGREVVRAFLQSGALVMAADVSEHGLKALQNDLLSKGLGERLATLKLDISKSKDCASAVDATRERFGGIDILINNGALGMGAIRDDHLTNLVDIEEISPEVWDRFTAVNFSGAWYLTRAAVPHMKRAGFGRIITVTTSFFTMLRGKFHPYGPVKAGLEAMAAGHAEEFIGTGITVNVVVPGGPTDTPMVPECSGLKRADLIPPMKMAYPMLWLASDAAGDVTGKRYLAAHWDETAPLAASRAATESPIGWPDLAGAPVWPGGKPNS